MLVYFRSRLKKDYDDFRRQPDHGQFTRELWATDECEGNPEREAPKAEVSKSVDAAEPLDTLEKEQEGSGRHPSFLNRSTERIRCLFVVKAKGDLVSECD
jgi:hypothetical protein